MAGLKTVFLHGASAAYNAVCVKETEDAFAYTVFALARASEANDDDTGNHISRVGEYCALLAAGGIYKPDIGRLLRLPGRNECQQDGQSKNYIPVIFFH